MNEKYSIGQMAKAGNCKVQTIRYCEKIGVLPVASRSEGNQRIYNQSHLDRLRFVRHGRELGFSLDQIRDILALRDDPRHSCEEVDRIARTHLQEVEFRLERLKDMQKEFKRMNSHCSGGQVASCRIIEVLSDHALCLSQNHQPVPGKGGA